MIMIMKYMKYEVYVVCRSPTTSIPHTFSPGVPLSSRVTRFLIWSLMHLTSSFLSQVTAWTIMASMLYKTDACLACGCAV